MTSYFATGILKPTKPYRLLVETASDALPEASLVQAAFNVLPPLRPAASSVDFTLAAPAKNDLNYLGKWLQVSRADLQYQVWRWDGRPSRQFPFQQIAAIDYSMYADPAPSTPPPSVAKQTLSTELLDWELETFATRLASDATLRPMARSSSQLAPSPLKLTRIGPLSSELPIAEPASRSTIDTARWSPPFQLRNDRARR